MAAMVCRLAVVSSLAPSRSTTWRYCGPGLDEGTGLGHRVGVVDGHLIVVALIKPHGLSAAQINGRIQFHLAAPSQFGERLEQAQAGIAGFFGVELGAVDKTAAHRTVTGML